MKHFSFLLFLLLPVAQNTCLAQDMHTIYYRGGQRLMQGRWTYQGNGALNTDRSSFYYLAQEGTHIGVPLLRLPGYRPDLDKDNLILIHLYCEGLIRIWFPDSTLKTEINYQNGIQEGPYTRYYPNGKKMLAGTLQNGMPQGLWKSYYNNGQLYFSGMFIPYTQAELETRWQKMINGGYSYEDEMDLYIADRSYAPETYLVRHAFDSLQPGVSSKKDGEFNFYDSTGHITASMNFRNNVPHGNWRRWEQDTLALELQYNTGKLEYITERGKRMSVTAYIAEQKRIWAKMQQYGVVEGPAENPIFTTVEQMPEFSAGKPENYIRKYINYPPDRKHYLDSSAIIGFYVNEDGTVGDVQVIQSAYAPFDRELVRVISGMPKWRPGKKNGVPVRMAYKLKLSFGLLTEWVR